MLRRTFLKNAVIAGALIVGSGHTPYGQWSAYRKRYLLILTNKTDASYPLGKQLAQILQTHLPESRARVARAPHLQRVASLISTKQLDAVLLRRGDGYALLQGKEPFAETGPVPLRSLIELGQYVLLCRDDFPATHAYQIAETLSRYRGEVSLPAGTGELKGDGADQTIPMHPGALAFYQGRSPPSAGFDQAIDLHHRHENRDGSSSSSGSGGKR